MPQCQRHDGEREHEAGGHEFFGLHPAHRKDNEQRHEDEVGDVRLENNSQGAQRKDDGETDRHVERDVAFGFVITDHAADEEQHDVDPKYGVRQVMHTAGMLHESGKTGKLRIAGMRASQSLRSPSP